MSGLTYFLDTESVRIDGLQGTIESHSVLTDLPQYINFY
jgi:hypothetical protein